MNRNKLRLMSGTALRHVLPLRFVKYEPVPADHDAGGSLVFRKGSPEYADMPRDGTITLEQKSARGVVRWTGVRPVFDDEAGTVTLNLPPKRITPRTT